MHLMHIPLSHEAIAVIV